MRPKILIFLSIFVIGALALLLTLPRPEKRVLGTEDQAQTTAKSVINRTSIEVGGKNYLVAWEFVENPEKLELLSNFAQKQSAIEVFEFEQCKILTSAGFYMRNMDITKDDKPTGLFITDGKTVRKFSQNSLTNGVLSINYFGIPRITPSLPQDPLRIALQAGPVLIDNTEARKLTLTSDSEDRRVVAGVTGENKLIFIVFYDPESAYLGPKLTDMPQALSKFEEKTKITLADAVNLDGGTASSFYTSGLKLSEIQNVGAFFCEK